MLFKFGKVGSSLCSFCKIVGKTSLLLQKTKTKTKTAQKRNLFRTNSLTQHPFPLLHDKAILTSQMIVY